FSVISASTTYAKPADDDQVPIGTKINIFKDPSESDVSESKSTATPWITALALPNTTRNIFKSPAKSDISEAETTSTPWIQEKFISTIRKFNNSVFENLETSLQVQKIWHVTSDSETTRRVYFKIATKFLTDLGHPSPQALANIVSKAGSLYHPLTMPIFFEVAAINLAEVFLAHNKDIDSDAARKYVEFLSSEIDRANLDDYESIVQAQYNAYGMLAESYGFDFKVQIDEFLELFVNGLIVLSEKKK
ncbi:hypothetical protein JTE90_007151, partial [Oedothorax gibbosus]